jgi:hypothetical protein
MAEIHQRSMLRNARATLLVHGQEVQRKFEEDSPATDWAEVARELAADVVTYLSADIRFEQLSKGNKVRRGR